MAEEDEGVTTGPTPDHAEQPGHGSAEPEVPVAGPTSEWTASDARGPLMGATAESITREPSASEPPPTTPASSSTGPKPQPAAGAPVVNPTKRGSTWPVAVGLVVGAGVGAAVALWVYPAVQPPAAADPQVAADVTTLSAKVAALEARPEPQASDAKSVTASIAALDAKITALQSTVAALPASPPAGPPQPAFDPAPLDQKIAALAAALATLKTQAAGTQDLATKVDSLGTALSSLQKQSETTTGSLQAIQDAQKSLEGEQKNLEGKVGTPAIAVVAGSLVQQIDGGLPYAIQVDALASLGADPVKLALLKQNAATGVPSAKALAADFVPLAEPILATGHKAPPNASFMDRMKSGMSSLVSIRRADDVSGSDLSSQVGRIQADLVHDDLTDALTAWTALPADAKAKSGAWATLAKTSAEAQAAAADLQSAAIAAMGGKKS